MKVGGVLSASVGAVDLLLTFLRLECKCNAIKDAESVTRCPGVRASERGGQWYFFLLRALGPVLLKREYAAVVEE